MLSLWAVSMRCVGIFPAQWRFFSGGMRRIVAEDEGAEIGGAARRPKLHLSSRSLWRHSSAANVVRAGDLSRRVLWKTHE